MPCLIGLNLKHQSRHVFHTSLTWPIFLNLLWLRPMLVESALVLSYCRIKHSIAFISKALSPRQQGLSTYEKNLWALVYAIDKWKTYLTGSHFVIRTDHRNLSFYLNNSYIPPYNREFQAYWIDMIMKSNTKGALIMSFMMLCHAPWTVALPFESLNWSHNGWQRLKTILRVTLKPNNWLPSYSRLCLNHLIIILIGMVSFDFAAKFI